MSDTKKLEARIALLESKWRSESFAAGKCCPICGWDPPQCECKKQTTSEAETTPVRSCRHCGDEPATHDDGGASVYCDACAKNLMPRDQSEVPEQVWHYARGPFDPSVMCENWGPNEGRTNILGNVTCKDCLTAASAAINGDVRSSDVKPTHWDCPDCGAGPGCCASSCPGAQRTAAEMPDPRSNEVNASEDDWTLGADIGGDRKLLLNGEVVGRINVDAAEAFLVLLNELQDHRGEDGALREMLGAAENEAMINAAARRITGQCSDNANTGPDPRLLLLRRARTFLAACHFEELNKPGIFDLVAEQLANVLEEVSGIRMDYAKFVKAARAFARSLRPDDFTPFIEALNEVDPDNAPRGNWTDSVTAIPKKT